MYEMQGLSQDPSSKEISTAWGREVLGEFDYSLDFTDNADSFSRLVVIYAENGMGKTTFLRGLYFLLNPSVQNLSSLAEMPLTSIGVRFRSGWMLEMRHSSDPEEFKMHFELRSPKVSVQDGYEFSVDSELLDNRFAARRWEQRPQIVRFKIALGQIAPPTEFVGENRAILSSLDDSRDAREAAQRIARAARSQAPNRMSVPAALDELANQFTKMTISEMSTEKPNHLSQGTYLDIANRVLSGTSVALDAATSREDIIARAGSVLKEGSGFEKYGLISLRQVAGILSLVEMSQPNDERLSQLHTVVDPFLTSISSDIERLRNAQRVIDTFVNSVNSFLDRKVLKFDAMKGISLVDKDNVQLDIESLSSGEQHLLLLLSRATLARFTGSLVIIDEPELSLGIRWQRILLRELLACTDGSTVQFLIASHSIQIMGELEGIVSPSETT